MIQEFDVNVLCLGKQTELYLCKYVLRKNIQSKKRFTVFMVKMIKNIDKDHEHTVKCSNASEMKKMKHYLERDV